jgi:hypothetical protein
MKSQPRSREHVRLVVRLAALAESYGATQLEALRADFDVMVRTEFLAHEAEVRAVEERWRRRLHAVGQKSPTTGSG